MRLPYASSDAPPGNDEDAAIYKRVQQRRHPRPLLPLDLALLQAPPIADGWNSFLGAIRSKTLLDDRFLELAVCRIAVLNGAAFEWAAHCPLAIKAGVNPELLETVKRAEPGGWLDGKEGHLATEQERVVLAYTDAMTREVRVNDGLFEMVKKVVPEREVVELTATIAAYNCVSRFLVALDVGEMNAVPVLEWKVG